MEIRGDEDDTRRLYAASMKGCVSSLNKVIKKDPLILKKVSITTFTETPLHVSALLGHHEFTKRLLNRNPKLAEELDFFKRSALHLASAEGHRDTVVALLEVYGDACLILDENGRIPLHYAAMRGRVEVLKELIQAKRESIYVNVQNGSSKETVLHLCVRHNKLECLKLLVEEVKEDRDFLNSRGCDGGMTIVLLALMLRQVETIKYLVSLPFVSIEENCLDNLAFNMLDYVLEHSNSISTTPREDFRRSLEIQRTLMDASIKRERNEIEQPISEAAAAIAVSEAASTIAVLEVAASPPPTATSPETAEAEVQEPIMHSPGSKWARRFGKWIIKFLEYKKGNWLEETRGMLMVVATMISSMTFQAAINPPGGVWQENVTNSTIGEDVYCSETNLCYAGTAVLAYIWVDYFVDFMTYNTISFLASLSVTLFLVSGFPLNHQIPILFLIMAISVTLVFTALAYLRAAVLVMPYNIPDYVEEVNPLWQRIWGIVFMLMIAYHILSFLVWLVRKFRPNRLSRWMSFPSLGRNMRDVTVHV